MIFVAEGIEKVMESGNATILDAFMKAKSVLDGHARARVSISGGGIPM